MRDLDLGQEMRACSWSGLFDMFMTHLGSTKNSGFFKEVIEQGGLLKVGLKTTFLSLFSIILILRVLLVKTLLRTLKHWLEGCLLHFRHLHLVLGHLVDLSGDLRLQLLLTHQQDLLPGNRVGELLLEHHRWHHQPLLLWLLNLRHLPNLWKLMLRQFTITKRLHLVCLDSGVVVSQNFWVEDPLFLGLLQLLDLRHRQLLRRSAEGTVC